MGIAENIFVKVDKLIFPVDFVILDMEEDPNMPLIQGRPFLYTVKAKFDMEMGKLTIRIGEDIIKFDMSRAIRQPSDTERCDQLEYCDRIDTIGPDILQDLYRQKIWIKIIWVQLKQFA